MTMIGIIDGRRLGGGTLARMAVAAGCDVVPSNSHGPRAQAASAADAAAAGDLVVLSIPPRAYPAVPLQPLARMLRFPTETIALEALAHDPTTTSRE